VDCPISAASASSAQFDRLINFIKFLPQMDKSTDSTSFKSTLAKEEMLIRAAINKYGTEVLVEDRTFDLISAIVYKKIKYAVSNRQDESDLKEGDGFTIWNLIYLLSFIISLVFLYNLLFPQEKGSQDGGKDDSNKDTSFFSMLMSPAESEKKKTETKKSSDIKLFVPVSIAPFEFQTGTEINMQGYCGRTKDFKQFYNNITKFMNQMKTLSRLEMDKMNAFSKQNYLLEGPPGTGKTIFVHYLATQVDRYLKLQHLAETDKGLYSRIISSSVETDQYVAQAPSRIYFCEVAPGVVNSKWHGESEKNINVLFETAKTLSELDGGRAVFLFFDEGDVFFGKRGGGDGSIGEIMAGLKSELLQRIGMRPKDKYRPIFVFCATNRFEVFDDAFKRRFGVQTKFGIPTEAERLEFVRFTLADFDVNETEIERIVALTQGRAQSFIYKYAMSHCIENSLDQIVGLRMRDYIEFLHNNRENRNLI